MKTQVVNNEDSLLPLQDGDFDFPFMLMSPEEIRAVGSNTHQSRSHGELPIHTARHSHRAAKFKLRPRFGMGHQHHDQQGRFKHLIISGNANQETGGVALDVDPVELLQTTPGIGHWENIFNKCPSTPRFVFPAAALTPPKLFLKPRPMKALQVAGHRTNERVENIVSYTDVPEFPLLLSTAGNVNVDESSLTNTSFNKK